MRRTYAARGAARPAEGEQGFWPSYADMMSAVALILFFLMLLSYIQNLITGNDLQNTQEVLAETRQTLSDTRATLDLTLAQVEEAVSELDKVTIDLADARLTLDEQKGQLDEQTAQLAAQKDELAAQDKLLADQKALIGEQEQYMKAANKELLEMRSRMQTIAVLRLSILEQIRDSVVAVMGDASKVTIGDNGAIVLDEGVLFDFGSSAVKPAAKPTLDRLVEVFKSFLADERLLVGQELVLRGQLVLLRGELGGLLVERELRLGQVDRDLVELADGLVHLRKRQIERRARVGEGRSRLGEHLLRVLQVVAGDEVLDIAQQHQEKEDQRHGRHHVGVGRPEALLALGRAHRAAAPCEASSHSVFPPMRRLTSRRAAARSRTARSMRSTLPRRL